MQHSPGFLKLVEASKSQIKEISVEAARARLAQNASAVLVDVREDHEWEMGHATEAQHLGRGIFERDLENKIPNPTTEIILYCGGGFRSALAAESAQKMGYQNVFSLAGGYKAMTTAGWPIKSNKS